MSTLQVQHPAPRSHRARRVQKYLRQEVLKTSPGEPLPTLREIMDRCQVGQARVQEVIADLERQGHLERKARRGVYRAEAQRTAHIVPSLDFIACERIGQVDQPGTFTQELLAALNLEATRRGHALRLHQIHRGQPLSEYEAIAHRPDVHACLLFAPHVAELVRCFHAEHIATLSLFPATDYETVGHCIYDPLDLMARMMEHLRSLGHERIGFLERRYPNAPRVLSTHRRAEYYRHMAERGLRVLPDWVADAGADEQTASAALERMLLTEPRPTAVLLPSVLMPTAYRVMERHRLRIGRDVALAGLDHADVCRHLHPAPTRIGVVHERTARLALDTLTALMENRPAPELQPAPVELTVGPSMQPGAETNPSTTRTTDPATPIQEDRL